MFLCLITSQMTSSATALGAGAVCLWWVSMLLLHWGWKSWCSHKSGRIFFSLPEWNQSLGTDCLDGCWLRAAEPPVSDKPANCHAFSEVYGAHWNCAWWKSQCSVSDSEVLPWEEPCSCSGLVSVNSCGNKKLHWEMWELPGKFLVSQKHSFHPSVPPAPLRQERSQVGLSRDCFLCFLTRRQSCHGALS